MKRLSLVALGLVMLMGITNKSIQASGAPAAASGKPRGLFARLFHKTPEEQAAAEAKADEKRYQKGHIDLEIDNRIYGAAEIAYQESRNRVHFADPLTVPMLIAHLKVIEDFVAVICGDALSSKEKQIARHKLTLLFKAQEKTQQLLEKLTDGAKDKTSTEESAKTLSDDDHTHLASAYAVLGLPNGTLWVDIRRAYRKLAMRHHPDKNNGIRTKRWDQIQAAYEILEDKLAPNDYT
ncbi:J domain-containing protein [Candidatus Dependentiae bacterium]|nr:J domain-containing protein [Candidatus Dependentiae bacterium]